MTIHPATNVEAGDLAGALDMVLASAALRPVRRFAAGQGGREAGRQSSPASPASSPRRGRELGGELAKVVTGASTLAPSPRDRRFADQAWTDNGLLRRLVQAYLATGRTAELLVEDAVPGLARRRADALPRVQPGRGLRAEQQPVLQPAGVEGADRQRRRERRARACGTSCRDLRERAARAVDGGRADAFEVGRNLAITPGSVVLRTEVFELIQYAPQTETVRERPLLIVPPTINKYYMLDLAEQRSMVEYLVQQGQQVFVISWRNPDARHAQWGRRHLRPGDPRRAGRRRGRSAAPTRPC